MCFQKLLQALQNLHPECEMYKNKEKDLVEDETKTWCFKKADKSFFLIDEFKHQDS